MTSGCTESRDPKKSWERSGGWGNDPLAVFNDTFAKSALILGLGLASACDSAQEGAQDTGTEASGDEAEREGTARITVTVDDGTVYEIEVRSCDTSATDPSGFPLSNGYVLSGQTADGEVELFVSRAGLEDDDAVFSGAVEGDFDEEGSNAKMLYSFHQETLTLQIDGAKVTGSVGSGAIGPTRPHGDNPVFTIDADCE